MGFKAWRRNGGTLSPGSAAEPDRGPDIVGQEGPPLPVSQFRSPPGLHGCSGSAGEGAVGLVPQHSWAGHVGGPAADSLRLHPATLWQ